MFLNEQYGTHFLSSSFGDKATSRVMNERPLSGWENTLKHSKVPLDMLETYSWVRFYTACKCLPPRYCDENGVRKTLHGESD